MAKQAKQIRQPQGLQLAVIHPFSAAIDVGSMLMMVSYSDEQGQQHLLQADGFTDSLQEVACTLKSAGVTHVAMEATGVYWVVVYELLEQQGFAVTLVNAKHFKNVDGQKTDVKDCQWLHQLHANGLLRASHIAGEAIRELKSYVHERGILQQQKSDTLNRIHKVLTQMNVKVQHLLSDMEGVSGMQLLRAIAEGKTDAEELVGLLDVKRLKASREELLKSLNGLYKKHFVTILGQALKAYDFFKEQMGVYEGLIEEVLQTLLPQDEGGNKPHVNAKTSHVRKNQYSINLAGYLKHILGTDVTQIDGIDEITALDVISVTGTDMSKWPTAGHFASWLNVAPRPRKSGGKVIGQERRYTNNKATQAFRMAAQSMWKSKSTLGQLYRRLSAQKGSRVAIKAVANKLAVIFYTMVKNKTAYDSSKLKVDKERQEAMRIQFLRKEAKKYGLVLQNAAA